MHIIKDATYLSDYKLRLVFDDGSIRVVDLAEELDGEIFEPLKDLDYFKQVRVDPELATIVWENGADLSPDYLFRISVPVTQRTRAA